MVIFLSLHYARKVLFHHIKIYCPDFSILIKTYGFLEIQTTVVKNKKTQKFTHNELLKLFENDSDGHVFVFLFVFLFV